MTEHDDARVAVYIDFDNIVISRYDQVHGRNQFGKDRSRAGEPNPELEARLEEATVDVGAILDYASSFGTLVLTRAYANWSDPVNARYQRQLVGRAVDLVQLFPAAAYGKNGADIRLAVDAVEDLFRLADLTHVVVVAGDSDYIALAQRAKRLGRYVVGIGVAGSTSRSLAAACDEMVTYDTLPVDERPVSTRAGAEGTATEGTATERITTGRGGAGRSANGQATTEQAGASGATGAPAGGETDVAAEAAPAGGGRTRSRRARASQQDSAADQRGDDGDIPEDAEDSETQRQAAATRLLVRALRLGHEKEDADWLHASAVKTQMRRMDPSFHERGLGHRSFSDFLSSRADVAEIDEDGNNRMVRLLD